jgi:hypothetical protein
MNESITTGLTNFPQSGTTELPPIQKGTSAKAIIRCLIFGAICWLAGRVFGIIWVRILAGREIEVNVCGLEVCSIIGFISGTTGQPAKTIVGAVLGSLAGAIVPLILSMGGTRNLAPLLLFSHPNPVEFGGAAGAIIGAMAGAYMGELTLENQSWDRERNGNFRT